MTTHHVPNCTTNYLNPASQVARKIVNQTGAKVAARGITSWLPIGAVYELLVSDFPNTSERARQVIQAKYIYNTNEMLCGLAGVRIHASMA
jgi:hypothetical protein